MLICKECEKFYEIGGEDGCGVCSLSKNYFLVNGDSPCIYLHTHMLTCKDCSHFGVDFACISADANDDICVGFEDNLKDEFIRILFKWLQRKEYNIGEVIALCEEFEEMPEVKFIQEYREEND